MLSWYLSAFCAKTRSPEKSGPYIMPEHRRALPSGVEKDAFLSKINWVQTFSEPLIWLWSRYICRVGNVPQNPRKLKMNFCLCKYPDVFKKKFLWVAALSFKCIEMYIEIKEKRKKNHTTHIPPWVANTPPLPAPLLHVIGLKIQVNIMWKLK